MNYTKMSPTFRIIILSFIFSTTIGYSLADWAPPSGTPPTNNVPPPLNVGSASQVRDGNLFINNWLVANKAQTASTIATDGGNILTTKDYVDMRINTISLTPGPAGAAGPAGASGAQGPAGPAGASPAQYVNMYQCPGSVSLGGGAWGYYGCQGQIQNQPTCSEVEYPASATFPCSYVGKMGLYP